MKCTKFHVSNQTHMHQIMSHNIHAISYLFHDFLSAIIRALKKSQNMYEIVNSLCSHLVHVSFVCYTELCIMHITYNIKIVNAQKARMAYSFKDFKNPWWWHSRSVKTSKRLYIVFTFQCM